MAGDIEGLAFLLKTLSSRDRHAADVTLYGLKRALVEVLAFFPVYRSYINSEQYSGQDRQCLSLAVARAKAANAGLLLELKFIERFLLLELGDHHSAEERNDWIHFVMRFQQLTGPLMAKGFEDTTLYVYNRLLSLNDVGGDPDQFGIAVEAFHDFNRRRSERWPHTMNATATHDTKRGEDARARINVLSELPAQWETQLKFWAKINRPKKTRIKGMEAPDRNDEYLLYQSLIGSFPPDGVQATQFSERLKGYLVKAVREAKVHTEWLKPDYAYEEAFVDFAEALLAPSEGNDFLTGFVPFARAIAYCGMFNSLAQTLLKIAAPGVPDIYQGTELWDLSFVDPDNRRDVDYSERRRLLEALQSADAADRLALMQDLLFNWQDGRIKLYLVHKLLRFRRAHWALFGEGEYLALETRGPMAEQICAFARRANGAWLVAIAPRLIGARVYEGKSPLAEFWDSTAALLPPGAPRDWRNIVTGEAIELSPENLLPLSQVLKNFPVALLHHAGPGEESETFEEKIDVTALQHRA
jgi:(1->4)-alpha-D-glucan 1-alpha-D-glucosylmutase